MSSDKLIIEEGVSGVVYKLTERLHSPICFKNGEWVIGFEFKDDKRTVTAKPAVTSKKPPYIDSPTFDKKVIKYLKELNVPVEKWQIAKLDMANRADEILKACRPEKSERVDGASTALIT